VAAHSTEHTLIAEPYVSALFSLARDAGAFDVVAQELGQLASLTAMDATFRRMVADPTIPPATKANAVRSLLSSGKASDLTVRFVERVALNGRLAALPTMHRLFIEKLADERGELHVQITSAKALSAAQQKELSASLAKATGKTIVPNVTIDPSLIAGLVIHAGSRMLDYSLQGRLRQMALALQPSRFNRT
jgi:F-type H+-transporting ATPase subunit delta